MKNSLILLFLWYSLTLSGATYYVSTTGSNNNNGSISAPFASINKAWSVVSAGDIIYVRGGTYTYAMMGQTVLSGKSGTSGNLITISNYPGENPVLNFSSSTFSSQVIGIWVHDANYIHLKGIRVTSITQPGNGSAVQYGLLLYDNASNCIFEQIETDHIGGWGVHISDYCNNNLFLNCDSHHNSDRYSSDSWGGADGFQSNSWNQGAGQTSTGNIFRGCRAWMNSDDGWDLRRADGVWTLENCWSFRNGYQPGQRTGDADVMSIAGDGMGLKFGTNFSANTTAIKKIAKSCLIFENAHTGIDLWTDGGYYWSGYTIYNCTVYKNGEVGFGCSDASGASTTTLRNNISYANSKGDYLTSAAWLAHDHNNFDIPITVTNADFASVNSVGMDGPRQADGNLPELNFLHLKTGSALIDKGVNVGIAYAGNAPDVGAFETSLTSTPSIPIFINSSIENATPAILSITYDLTLAGIVPAASAFSVMVNSAARTVSSVAISGSKVQLTLSSPVVYGDVVTIAYTKPINNPIQTTSGGQAITISAQSVTNNVGAVNPVYVSSAIQDATPSLLEMTYNMTLANTVPAASAFSVKVNSVVRTVSSVIISGSKVQLTLSSPVVYGDVVTITYTKPTNNPIQTTSGGQAITISAQSVTNNVSAVNPVYVSSAIQNATPSLLEMTYNITLANTVSAASAFSVMVNSAARTVSSVAISGSKVQLTLSSPVVYGDVVTIAYTKPTNNPIQTTSGGQAITISAQSVTNNVGAVNPVYVSSAIQNATPSLLEMTYNMTLANTVPAASAFSVKVNSAVRTVSSVVISGSKVQLTLASRVFSGDIVTISYSKPTNNPIQTQSAGIAAGITNQPVSNNCVNVPPTAVIISPALNSSFTSPAIISITANAFDSDGTVSLVEFYNGSTKLGSTSSAPYTFSWNNVPAGNYTLTVIATDNQNSKTVSSGIHVSVVNSSVRINKRPYIKISNPRKGNTYASLATITIDALASDSDGTISKVEFFSNSVKLVELYSDPYTYTWKDVPAGKYSITAVAIDDSNDSTASSAIEFEVGSKIKYDSNSDIINLYPNPNNGHFTIDFVNPLQDDKSQIIITDLAGKQVYNGPVYKEETSKQIDVSDSKSGIYVMMIKDKEIFVTKKFIKK